MMDLISLYSQRDRKLQELKQASSDAERNVIEAELVSLNSNILVAKEDQQRDY